MEAIHGINLKQEAAAAAKQLLQERKDQVRRLILDKLRKLDSDKRRLQDLQDSIECQEAEIKMVANEGCWALLEWKSDSSEEA